MDARLYLVTDAVDDRVVEAALAGGVDVVQLRMKGAPDDDVLAVGRRFRRLTHGAGALFVVNDRPDLALRLDADGVHVGQEDMPVEQVRELVGKGVLVGLSTHTPEQIRAAADVDYIGVGPVYATPTKAEALPVGLDLVREAARSAAVPWFAIGGIDTANVAEVVAAGATRVAVVRAIRDADDPRAAAAALLRELAGARD